MKKNKVPEVVITRMSKRWSYFQYFLLGLYELDHAGEIKLRFRCGLLNRLSVLVPNISFVELALSVLNHRLNHDGYNLEGYIVKDGRTRYFALDSADAPYLYDCDCLTSVDKYYKMQCPANFNIKDGFCLSDGVFIPYCDHDGVRKIDSVLSDNMHKVRPFVVGFRRLAVSNGYKALKKGYDNYLKASGNYATKKAMCYFGNALGPKPSSLNGQMPNWDSESDIMAYFAGSVSHPNEKRSVVGRIMRDLGSQYDSRIICDDYADSRAERKEDLIVPLRDFCNHISRFEYNVNVSGYRLSIPNRFIESFVVGTAILTDKLSVKWYLPFGEEVVETVRMGYDPVDKVDWDGFKQDLESLPHVDKEVVQRNFREKWAPKVVAKYLVFDVIESV